MRRSLSAALLLPSGAVEVFLDATRGEIKKIPIAVFTFNEKVPVKGGNLTDVLKADLRRSLLFEIPDLRAIGVQPESHLRPPEDAIRKAGDAGLSGRCGEVFLRRERRLFSKARCTTSSVGVRLEGNAISVLPPWHAR